MRRVTCPSHDCARRSFVSPRKLLTDTLIRGDLSGTLLIATDGFKFYKPIICKHFGLACVYAEVIKTWQQGRVARFEHRVVIGTERRLEQVLFEPGDSARANTAFVERLNVTLRPSTAYLRRLGATHAAETSCGDSWNWPGATTTSSGVMTVCGSVESYECRTWPRIPRFGIQLPRGICRRED